MKFTLYYRLWHGIDALEEFKSLEAMQSVLKPYTDDDFEYINACVVCDDGSEEIVYSSHKQITEAK